MAGFAPIGGAPIGAILLSQTVTPPVVSTVPNYAGVPFTQPTVQLAALIERYISLKDVIDFPAAQYLNVLGPYLPYPDQRLRPIKLGSLFWPQGATRWAVGHFLATEKQLAAIRTALGYDQPGFVFSPATLILDDATTTISTLMWMLPPRPLFQNPLDVSQAAIDNALPVTKWLLPIDYNFFPVDDLGNTTEPQGEQLYLVTLVDNRFFWWQKQSTITVTVGTTTWASLISQIGTSLGETITTDTIPAAYLKPFSALLPYLQYLPFLLDHCAFALGMRVVRDLAGNVSLQSATTAITSADSQLATATSPFGGGIFAVNLS